MAPSASHGGRKIYSNRKGQKYASNNHRRRFAVISIAAWESGELDSIRGPSREGMGGQFQAPIPARKGDQIMMSGLERHVRYSGTGSGLAFAVKVIGVGLFAGLVLTYCNVLLDACMSGIR